jgi:hypothetical protein
MDWLLTLLAAAGTEPDPGHPPDGMNLLALTGNAALVDRKLFWRYKEVAARRTHRRLQVPQNPGQHLLVQRGQKIHRARQS